MVELTLKHDDKKQLKGGKRRYVDADGHNLYLTGDEVEALDNADEVTVQIKAKA